MAYIQEDDEKDKIENQASAGAPTASLPGSGPQGGATPAYTKSGFTSGKMILDKNKDAAQPNLGGAFQKKASESEQNLANQQTAYNQGLENTKAGYNFDQDYINRAVGGSADEFSKIQQALSGSPNLATASYNPGLDIRDVNALNSNAGVAGMMRDQAAERGEYNYGLGQSALDAALYGKSSQGRGAQVGNALQKYQDVNKEYGDAKTSADAARQAASEAIAKSVGSTKDTLSAKQQALVDANIKQSSDFGKQAIANEKNVTSNRRNEIDQAIQEYAQGEAKGDDNYAKFLTQQLQDAARKQDNLYDVSYDPLASHYNEGQAGEFNRINQLLGKTGQDVSAGSADPQYTLGKSFNRFLNGNIKQAEENWHKPTQGGGQLKTGSDSPLPGGGPPATPPGVGKGKKGEPVVKKKVKL